MNIALLLSAGRSTRAGQNKLWAEVHGRPLWTLAHDAFVNHPNIDRIILVVPKSEELRYLPFIQDEKTSVIAGGDTRMGSFKKGLEAAGTLATNDVILDHNAANPFVTAEEISAVLRATKEHGAAAVAHPVVDTVAEVDSSGAFITDFHDRSNLRLMQTPQAVRADVLESLQLSETTDLASALLGYTQVRLLPAHPLNRKITFAEDLQTLCAHTTIGEDSHRFSNEGQLVFGGLTIPDLPKLEANSDGDVVLHAIGRALATAQNQNFSELADPLMLGGDFDSRDYLEPLLEGVKILDVSLSIEGAQPRIDPLSDELKKSLATILNISESSIHISAHTGEDLTAFGRGEGLRCLALVKTLPR